MMYIEINEIDYSSQIRQRDITVPDQLNERNQVSFVLYGSASDRPSIGQEVIFYDSSEKINKKYAGIIEDKREKEHGPDLQWDLNCVGYERILDRFLVPESYTNETCSAIITDIFSQFVPAAESITLNNVETGPTIEKAVFGYDWTVAKVLDKLSDITGYFWYVDYDKDLHFEERTKNEAEFDIDDNSVIYNFEVENTREEYRNQQYIRAGQGTSEEVTDSFAGDGEQRTFQFRGPLAEEPAIKINGVAIDSSDIGIRELDEGKKWYWQHEDKTVNQDDSETVLTSSDTLEIVGKYLYPIRVFSELGGEIEDRKTIESNSGIYPNVVDRKNINDSNAAQQEAEGLLQKYGEIPEKIYYFTFDDGLQAGQLQRITRSKHNIDGQYLISNVTLKPYGWNNGNFKFGYQITALSGDYIGSWIDFFRKIAEAGKDFVIRENEVLIKIKTFSELLRVNDDLSIDKGAYETRINYAEVGFSEISKNQNIVGLTEAYADFTSIRNGEGLTDTVDTDYKTLNIGGLTESLDFDNNSINIIGLTDPDSSIVGGNWVWVEGVSSPYE